MSESREILKEAAKLEKEQQLIPPEPHLPELVIPEIASGRIMIFMVSFYVIAFAVRIFLLPGPSLLALLKHFTKAGQTVPHSPSILYDCFLYISLACTFFPIPTIPPIAFTAKAFNWVLVAAVCSLGTCLANLNDYAILGLLFRHHRVKKIRDVKSYRRFLKFFDRYAFLTVVVGAFLPIPVDVIRMLAISRAYPIWKYIAATFVGRFPRYLIITYAGKELPAKYILIIFGITLIPPAYKIVVSLIRKYRTK